MNTPKLTLGQRVTITDFLARADLTAKEVLALAGVWPEVPAPVVHAAHAELERQASGLRLAADHYRVFVPSSLMEWPRPRGLEIASTASKHHPVPWRGDITFPLHGIVIQQVQLQDGSPFYEEYGSEFHRMSTRRGFKVAYRLDRRSLTVLPSMIGDPS